MIIYLNVKFKFYIDKNKKKLNNIRFWIKSKINFVCIFRSLCLIVVKLLQYLSHFFGKTIFFLCHLEPY